MAIVLVLRRVFPVVCALLVMAAVATAILAPKGSPPRGRAGTSAPNLRVGFFGVNAGALFDASQAQWPVQLSAMQRGGIKLVRSDAEWNPTEPKAPVGGVHSYDWSHFDAIETSLAQHQLTWSPIIDFSAWWASALHGNVYAPPANDSDYATYAAALTKRYGANGDFWRAHPELPYLPVEQWEIWNEENFGSVFWQTGADPARYVDLYLAARSAIRSIDPNAKAVVGGLGDGPNSYTTFIARMYQHRPDANGQIDAIGFHPYPLDDAATAASAMQGITTLRNYLNSIGDQTVPLEITEVGWTTDPNGGVSDGYRAQQLTQLLNDLASSNQGVSKFMPYAWITNGQSNDDYFAIYNRDGSPTQEGTAYLQAIKKLTPHPAHSMGPAACQRSRHRLRRSTRRRRCRTRSG